MSLWLVVLLVILLAAISFALGCFAGWGACAEMHRASADEHERGGIGA